MSGCRPDRHLFSVCLCKSSLAHLHASSLLQPCYRFEIEECPESHSYLMVAQAWLFEHGGACVERTQLVNLQRSGSRELTHRDQRSSAAKEKTCGTFLVRFRLLG